MSETTGLLSASDTPYSPFGLDGPRTPSDMPYVVDSLRHRDDGQGGGGGGRSAVSTVSL